MKYYRNVIWGQPYVYEADTDGMDSSSELASDTVMECVTHAWIVRICSHPQHMFSTTRTVHDGVQLEACQHWYPNVTENIDG